MVFCEVDFTAGIYYNYFRDWDAGVAELVDATDLKSVGLTAREGSIPSLGTKSFAFRFV